MNSKPACTITHPQIDDGDCPWCKTPIVNGTAAADTNGSTRMWNVQALKRDLASPDRDVRMMTLANVRSHGPPPEIAIDLLVDRLDDSDRQVQEHACLDLSSIGYKLSAQQADELESQVRRKTPSNELALRCVLAAYHFMHQESESPSGFNALREHVLWLIQNAPELSICGSSECCIFSKIDRDGYQAAKTLWLSHVEADGDNLEILANASNFFAQNDFELAEELLVRARSLQPDEPRWHKAIGQLYSQRSTHGGQVGADAATLSFAAFTEAERVSGTHPEKDPTKAAFTRLRALPNLATTAFDACEFEAAKNYASELLTLANSEEIPEYFRNSGRSIFRGNLILGCVAMQEGDIESAKRYLLASGKTKGGPALGSFGPNMTLAKALLEAGQRDVVLEFFEQCTEFWKMVRAS